MPLHSRRVGGDGRVVEQLPLDGEDAFDLVCAFEVLEHIEDDLGALEQWRGRLKPDGWILLSVPAHAAQFGPSDEHAGHFRRYERAELTERLEKAGFRVVSLRSYGVGLGVGAPAHSQRHGPARCREPHARRADLGERTVLPASRQDHDPHVHGDRGAVPRGADALRQERYRHGLRRSRAPLELSDHIRSETALGDTTAQPERHVPAYRRLLEQRAKPLSRRTQLIVTVVLVVSLVVATVWAWHSAPCRSPDINWYAIAVAFAIGSPATLVLKMFEYDAAARLIGSRAGPRRALEVSIVSSAANLLPVPGSLLVTTRSLSEQGATYGEAAVASAIPGLAWLAPRPMIGGVSIMIAGARSSVRRSVSRRYRRPPRRRR